MNISLYQLTNEHQRLLSQLYDYETGEVNEEVEAQLSALSETTEKKCIAIASYMKNIEADKAQLDHVKREIAEREAAFNKKLEQLHYYLKSNMERQKMTEVSCPYFTLKIKNNPYSTDILNEADIPSQFMNTREIIKVEYKPDKNAIKEEVLRTGIQIPGALVHQKTKLEITTKL